MSGYPSAQFFTFTAGGTDLAPHIFHLAAPAPKPKPPKEPRAADIRAGLERPTIWGGKA